VLIVGRRFRRPRLTAAQDEREVHPYRVEEAADTFPKNGPNLGVRVGARGGGVPPDRDSFLTRAGLP